jgi:hypothetical protein
MYGSTGVGGSTGTPSPGCVGPWGIVGSSPYIDVTRPTVAAGHTIAVDGLSGEGFHNICRRNATRQ